MNSIKPIIGIVSFVGMVEKNIEIFDSLNCIVVEIKTLEDIESVDAVIFPSSVYMALNHYIGDDFIEFLTKKMLFEDFPVWLMGESIRLFEDKFYFNNVGMIDESEEEIMLDFLDVKPLSVRIMNACVYTQKRLWFNLFQSYFKPIAHLSTGEVCIYRRKKVFITLFSPEECDDLRIYEYFLNEILLEN